MKKLYAILLCVTVLLAFAGCNDTTTPDSTSGGGQISDDGRSYGGYYEGKLGEKMETYFFDFVVNSAERIDDYQGYQATPGNELILVDLSVINTWDDELWMFYWDFQIQWGDNADDAFGYPILDIGEGLLGEEFELEGYETVTGKYVFEVPLGTSEYSVSYLEIYEDDFEGDVFFVFFTLPAREGGEADLTNL